MSQQSTNLLFPYLAPGQAQKHVTVNDSLRRLDALVQLSVISASTAAEPGSPADGAVYIVPSGDAGAPVRRSVHNDALAAVYAINKMGLVEPDWSQLCKI